MSSMCSEFSANPFFTKYMYPSVTARGLSFATQTSFSSFIPRAYFPLHISPLFTCDVLVIFELFRMRMNLNFFTFNRHCQKRLNKVMTVLSREFVDNIAVYFSVSYLLHRLGTHLSSCSLPSFSFSLASPLCNCIAPYYSIVDCLFAMF